MLFRLCIINLQSCLNQEIQDALLSYSVGMLISGKNVQNSLKNIWILFKNRSIKKYNVHKRTQTSYTHLHSDTGRGFYDLYEINLVNSSTAPSTTNYFNVGLGYEIGLHAPKTDRYLFMVFHFYLFVFLFTERSQHDGELDVFSLWVLYRSIYVLG